MCSDQHIEEEKDEVPKKKTARSRAKTQQESVLETIASDLVATEPEPHENEGGAEIEVEVEAEEHSGQQLGSSSQHRDAEQTKQQQMKDLAPTVPTVTVPAQRKSTIAVLSAASSHTSTEASATGGQSPITSTSLPVSFSVGALVEALDDYGNWCVAAILKVQHDRVLVHYQGWTNQYDEWIPVASSRFERIGTHCKRGESD